MHLSNSDHYEVTSVFEDLLSHFLAPPSVAVYFRFQVRLTIVVISSRKALSVNDGRNWKYWYAFNYIIWVIKIKNRTHDLVRNAAIVHTTDVPTTSLLSLTQRTSIVICGFRFGRRIGSPRLLFIVWNTRTLCRISKYCYLPIGVNYHLSINKTFL